MRLCVGDDWAQDHHDIEVMDEAGMVLATGRLPEGVAGIGRLHELIGRFLPAGGDAQVQVGIETDRGPWGGGADRRRVCGVRCEPATGVPVPGRQPQLPTQVAQIAEYKRNRLDRRRPWLARLGVACGLDMTGPSPLLSSAPW